MTLTWPAILNLVGLVVFAIIILVQWRKGELKGGRLLGVGAVWLCLTMAFLANRLGW